MRVATTVVLCLAGVAFGQEPEPAQDIADLDLDALLNQDIRTQKVTVASRREETVGDAPATLSVISSEDFVKHDWRNVAEALRSVPGLYVSWGRDAYATGVRGLSFPGDKDSRVLVLVDGHAFNNPWNGQSSTTELMSLPPDAIERVEVIRGPASSVYGSNAFFAVVNIVSKRPSDASPRRLSVDLFGSTTTLFRMSLTGHARFGFGLELSGFGMVLGGDGPNVLYEDQTRPRLNLGVHTPSAGLARGTDFERGASAGLTASFKGLTLTAQIHNRIKGLPGAPGDSIFGDPFNAVADLHGLVDLAYRLELGAHLITARAWFDRFDTRRTLHEDPSDWEMGSWVWGDPRVVSEGRAQSFGGELQGSFELHAKDTLTVGVEVRRSLITQPTYELDPTTGRPDPATIAGGIKDATGTIRPTEPINVGGYLQNEWRAHARFTLVVGARYDFNTVFFRSESPLAALGPRAAAVYKPSSDATLKLSYGEAFRYPSVSEAFFDDRTSVCGNTHVQPERQRTAELSGVTNVRRAYNLSGTLFFTQVEGLLVRQSIDPCYVGSGRRDQFVNAGQVLVFGGEAGVDVRLSNVTAFVNAGATYASQTVGALSTRPANSPALVAGAGVALPILDANRLGASLRAHFVSSRLVASLDPNLTAPPAVRFEGSLTGRRIWHGLSFGVTGIVQVKVGRDNPLYRELVPRDPVTGSESVAAAVPQNLVEVRAHAGWEL